MVKRSIEQEIRNKNFGARTGNYERNARGQESRDKTAWTTNSWRLLAMGSQRAVCERKQLQFPPRYHQAWKNYTIKSVSEFFHAAEWAKIIENPTSQRKKSQLWNVSMALQGLLQRNLNQFILKSGILRSACATSPKMDAVVEKSALMHIARLKNSLAKGPKKNGDKSSVAMLKKTDLHESIRQPGQP